MDDQKIELKFQVDTSQVDAAVKASAQAKAAIDDVDKANDKAAKNAAKRAGDAADKAAKAAQDIVDSEAKKAAQLEAIETKFLAAEYKRQVKRQADAEKAEQARVDTAWKSWEKQDEAAEKSASKTEKAAARTKQGVAGVGQSFLQTGRIVQDFAQGGIGGVLNNIEGLVMALGGPAGLAGILTVVGVGFLLLKPKIMEFMASLNPEEAIATFKGGVESLKERIKELEGKPVRLAVEDFELKRLKSQVDELIKATEFAQRLLTKQTKDETSSGRAVEDALVETPGAREAVDQVRQKAIDKALAESKTVQENEAKVASKEQEVNELRAGGYDEWQVKLAEKQLEKLREANRIAKQAIAETEGAKIGGIELKAVQGRGKDQAVAQEQIAKILEQAGLKDAAEEIRAHGAAAFKAGTTPEDVTAQSERLAAKSATEGEAELKRLKDVQKRDAEEEENRNRVAREEAKEDTKTNKALGKTPLTAEQIAKQAKDAEALDKKVEAAREKADTEALNLKTPSGANVADLYSQSRMQISMLPKNQQAKAKAALDKEVQAVAAQSFMSGGATPAAAAFKAGAVPGRLDRLLQEFMSQGGVQGGLNMAKPKRFVGKRNRALAERAAAKRAKSVTPVKAAGAKGEAGKVAGETKEVKTELEKQTALLEDIARKPPGSTLS